MSDPQSLQDSHNAISLRELESGATPCVAQDGPIAALFGQALAPANLSARQAKALGFLTSGIYGQHGITSLPSATLTSLWVSRLQALTASVGSTLYSLTWKQRVTPGGAVDLCAAGVGAPHIRQRSWFVAERLADMQHSGSQGGIRGRADSGRQDQYGHAGCDGAAGGMADSSNNRLRGSEAGTLEARSTAGRDVERSATDECREFPAGLEGPGTELFDRGATRPTDGFWRDADWLSCRDGKWRPVESGTFPLAHGITNRVGRLRAYGNAVNAEAATAVIRAYMS